MFTTLTLPFARVMAQQLWLLRHGEAEPHDARPDEDRRLTARGERQADAAGAALARLGLEFTACLTSPRVRALDTATRACAALGLEPEVRDSISKGFDADTALDVLAEHDGDARLLVVGHDPDLSRVVADLSGARVDFKKGGIAAVRLHSRSGELVALLRPRELETLAG